MPASPTSLTEGAGRGHTDGDTRRVAEDTGGVVLGESADPALAGDWFPLDWRATRTSHLDALPNGAALVPGHGRPVDAAFARGWAALDLK